MAGTTGLEPATSAVTAKRKRVTHRKQGATDDTFSALRTHGNSYCTLIEPTTSVFTTSAFLPRWSWKRVHTIRHMYCLWLGLRPCPAR